MGTDTEYVVRIFVAAIFGGIIGLERNYRAKEAGFRTHFLVALGSALFMVISQYGFDLGRDDAEHVSLDPSRIASQVVTGIGFLGAGTIIFQRHAVRGLTTAAGVWVTAAIGLACGSGMYALAAGATILTLLCLEIFSVMLERFGTRTVSVTFSAGSKTDVATAMEKLQQEGTRVSSCKIKEESTASGKKIHATMEVRVKRAEYKRRMLDILNEFENVGIESIE